MLRAVFFDLDDTLVDRTGAVARALAALLARHPDACPAPGREALLDWALALDARGARGLRPLSEALLARLPTLPFDAPGLEAALVRGLMEGLAPQEGVLRVVRRALALGPVAVVSNGSGARQREKLARAGLDGLLPAVFVSGEVGAEKPHPALFEAALGWAGVPAEAVLFVGDDPERDVAPAARLGLQTCWVSHGRPWPDGPVRPGRVVGRVEELAGVLG